MGRTHKGLARRRKNRMRKSAKHNYRRQLEESNKERPVTVSYFCVCPRPCKVHQ